MYILIGVIVVLVVGFIVAQFVWRGLSRRRSLPCPTWLAWALGPMASTNSPILDRMELEAGMRVADVGCGPGRLTIPLAHRVGPDGEVVALDIQQGMLDKLAKRVAAANISIIRPILGGAGEGKLPKDHFDRALLVTVLGEIPDRGAALEEIRGALKPGGRLYVHEILLDPHYQTVAKVKELAAAAGLDCSTVHSTLLSATYRLERPVSDQPS